MVIYLQSKTIVAMSSIGIVLTTSALESSAPGLLTTNCRSFSDKYAGLPKYNVRLIIFTNCQDASQIVYANLDRSYKTGRSDTLPGYIP